MPQNLVPDHPPSNSANGNGSGHSQRQLPPMSTPAQPAPSWQSWAKGGSDADDKVPWQRYFAALLRYKWLMLAVVIAGSAAGLALIRLIEPQYEVHATIWIARETGQDRERGPIRSTEVMTAKSWPELLRSFAILDRVVQQEALYITPANIADRPIFAGFRAAQTFRPGVYELQIAENGASWVLTGQNGYEERGAVGDSIGRRLGFMWRPDSAMLQPGATIPFSMVTPREASIGLRERLGSGLGENSNLLRLYLRDSDPQVAARTLNALVREFVAEAAELSRRKLTEFRKTLEQQKNYAQQELTDAEIALENFRVNTITLPSEAGGAPVAGGVQETRDPVLRNFFNQKVELDSIRGERVSLQRTLAEIQAGTLDVSALWAIPVVASGPQDLRNALNELSTRDTELRLAQQTYTDEHRTVRELQSAVTQLRRSTIPQLAGTLVSQLQRREADLDGRITTASREIRDIPTRTIEEMRLRRNMEVRDNLYTTLKNRFEEARLAEASAIADVSILDSAVAPLRPSSNTAPRLLMMAIMGSLGAAVVIALLLDRFDRRFRYPEQATAEMGLTIFGAVPNVPRAHRSRPDPEQAAQIVESFRSIRLNLLHAFPEDSPVFVTVSSPGPGDGKSLISSNLALSFAESGRRTLLVDGDIRRGALHRTFGVMRRPGLIDYLAGTAPLDKVIQPTSHERLSIVPCGTRRPEGPELLMSQAMTTIAREAKAQFDVVIVDSPPLGAGIDPFVLATNTGNMLLVMRAGETDRKMAQAKLELIERLPIQLLGVILNDITSQAGNVYEYYAYTPGYATNEDQDERFSVSQVGQLTRDG